MLKMNWVILDYLRFLPFLCLFFFACSKPSALEQTLSIAEKNKPELQKVLKHYKRDKDKRKYKAALYLISNMGNKFHYEGEILDNYMPLFEVYDSIFNAEVINRKDKVIQETWDKLAEKHGHIDFTGLSVAFDCSVLSADFIIKNIEDAFMAWESSPFYNPNDFNIFCEYILPYKIANESPEAYRERYYNDFKHILDTVSSFHGLIHGFGYELYENLGYQRNSIFGNYPIDLPISLMEKSKGGLCRHMVILETAAMRACGLPVTFDEVIWANRSQGHTWNVVMSDTGKIVEFDALEYTPMTALKYKPAKIFRKRNSWNLSTIKKMDFEDIPLIPYFVDDEDVTHEYTQTFNISVPITFPYKGGKKEGEIAQRDTEGYVITGITKPYPEIKRIVNAQFSSLFWANVSGEDDGIYKELKLMGKMAGLGPTVGIWIQQNDKNPKKYDMGISLADYQSVTQMVFITNYPGVKKAHRTIDKIRQVFGDPTLGVSDEALADAEQK